nr:TRAP transporter large permease subunit [Pseudomonadota bacterium]
MLLLVLFGSLALLFISGIPIAFALFISSLIYLLLIGEYPLNIVAQKFISGPDSFTLLAIPLFVSAGALMNLTGITRRIFGVANALVGHLAGGLGHVNIVASIIFSGMSGAAMADAAGLGLIEIKAMREAGYDDDFSVAVTASSSIIGPIIPPSVPAVIYGTVASVSVGGLFLGGIIPGLMMGLFLMVLVTFYAKRRGYPRGKRVSFGELLRVLYEGFLPLMTPVIIIGGIWTGWFTPTEAAGAACVYAI